jgi:hypothetical protein
MLEAACKKLNAESTRVPQEILVTHSLSTRSEENGRKSYGCIVFSGDGDGDTIGDIAGDGAGCAAAATLGGGGTVGDMDGMGDIMGDIDGIG